MLSLPAPHLPPPPPLPPPNSFDDLDLFSRLHHVQGSPMIDIEIDGCSFTILVQVSVFACVTGLKGVWFADSGCDLLACVLFTGRAAAAAGVRRHDKTSRSGSSSQQPERSHATDQRVTVSISRSWHVLVSQLVVLTSCGCFDDLDPLWKSKERGEETSELHFPVFDVSQPSDRCQY